MSSKFLKFACLILVLLGHGWGHMDWNFTKCVGALAWRAYTPTKFKPYFLHLQWRKILTANSELYYDPTPKVTGELFNVPVNSTLVSVFSYKEKFLHVVTGVNATDAWLGVHRIELGSSSGDLAVLTYIQPGLVHQSYDLSSVKCYLSSLNGDWRVPLLLLRAVLGCLLFDDRHLFLANRFWIASIEWIGTSFDCDRPKLYLIVLK